MENNTQSDYRLFKDLAKDEQKALRKEFMKSSRIGKLAIVLSIVFVVCFVVILISGIMDRSWQMMMLSIMPACFGGFTVPMMIDVHFTGWLLAKKIQK